MRPLKQPDSGSIVDPLLVDEMFYQIPEILEHHEQFLEQVASCVHQWHDRQTVGHLLIQSVSRCDDKLNSYGCSSVSSMLCRLKRSRVLRSCELVVFVKAGKHLCRHDSHNIYFPVDMSFNG